MCNKKFRKKYHYRESCSWIVGRVSYLSQDKSFYILLEMFIRIFSNMFQLLKPFNKIFF